MKKTETKTLKLYEIPQESRILAYEHILSKDEKDEKWVPIMITFHRLDGMYSYCTTEDGRTCHLSVSTPLVKKKDKKGVYYEVKM